MAGISLSVEGNKIQLSFQKDDQATAVLMDAGAARTLASALNQLLDALDDDMLEALEVDEGDVDDDDDEALTEELMRQLSEDEETIEGEVVDVTSPSIDIGLDEEGRAIIGLQAGQLPPFLLRLRDDEARHIAESLGEILSAPRDARLSQGGH